MSPSTAISPALESVESPHFPGRVVKVGETDRAVVLSVQRRLNALGGAPIDHTPGHKMIEEDGIFGSDTENAVKLFQARFADANGRPLIVDGQIGALTWGALFGTPAVPPVVETNAPLLGQALAFAVSQIGVMEEPLGSNRGPHVDQFLRAVGLNPAEGHFPRCIAFVYWCFEQGAQSLTRGNPVIKTAGVLDHWHQAEHQGVPRIMQAQAVDNPALIQPGFIFAMDFGGGAGHAGFVEEVSDGRLITIEGNSNPGGSREGIGVFRREGRKINSINLGFIDYSNR